MELGEKIRKARLEAGLSQRQLCGDTITRNMLSQIENGGARPSMDTLKFLAAGLGKSVSFFLEEEAVTSPNQALMEQGRAAYRRSNWADALEILEDFREPDPQFREEWRLLRALCLMELGKNALDQGRLPYAAELLERAGACESIYRSPALERERLLLLARAGANVGEICQALKADDRELLLRAEAALEAGDPRRAMAYLEAAENREDPRWCLLAGKTAMGMGEHSRAAELLGRVEDLHPEIVIPLLEVCYRELGDFRRAYEYACKGR